MYTALRGRGTPRFRFLVDEPPGPDEFDDDSSHAARRVAWRLLAANNRPIGRSVHTHGSLREAQESARTVTRLAGDGLYTLGFHSAQSRWGWTLTVQGHALATATHLYQRRVECQRGAEQFRLRAGSALSLDDTLWVAGASVFAVYDESGAPATVGLLPARTPAVGGPTP